jgi:orotate phosphoribosyltransferase
MNTELLNDLPAREGHFLLESGHHTDLWLTLDNLFVSPRHVGPLVKTLAGRLQRHDVAAVCGPLQGGAFLAQSVATVLGLDFYFSEPAGHRHDHTLFGTEYRIPNELQRRMSGQRIAIVDDVISAGSSVRATVSAAVDAGATIGAIGTLLVLGTIALDHFAGLAIPVESLAQRDFALWEPSACPLCAAGTPLENLLPGTHQDARGARGWNANEGKADPPVA